MPKAESIRTLKYCTVYILFHTRLTVGWFLLKRKKTRIKTILKFCRFRLCTSVWTRSPSSCREPPFSPSYLSLPRYHEFGENAAIFQIFAPIYCFIVLIKAGFKITTRPPCISMKLSFLFYLGSVDLPGINLQFKTLYCREACLDSASLPDQLVIWSERLTSILEDVSSNSLLGHEVGRHSGNIEDL